MPQKLRDAFAKADAPDMGYVIKKGSLYIGEKNNELFKTKKQGDAFFFPSEEDADKFLEWACIDTRNANVMGTSHALVEVFKTII